ARPPGTSWAPSARRAGCRACGAPRGAATRGGWARLPRVPRAGGRRWPAGGRVGGGVGGGGVAGRRGGGVGGGGRGVRGGWVCGCRVWGGGGGGPAAPPPPPPPRRAILGGPMAVRS